MGRFTGRPWDICPNVALGLAHGGAIGKRVGSEFLHAMQFSSDAVLQVSLRLRRIFLVV